MADLDIAKPSSVWRADVNGDGAFTISDAFLWLGEAFFLPGDWLIWAIATYSSPIARFLEIGSADYGGVLSGFVSALAWLALMLATVIVYGTVRDFDRALTARILRWYDEARRRIRIGYTLLGYRLRRVSREPPKREAIEMAEDVELDRGELVVLRLHANLQPGYALAESEVAQALKIGKNHAQALLARLRKLGLLETTVGGGGGENAYRLTAAGRGLLVYRQLDKATAGGNAPHATPSGH